MVKRRKNNTKKKRNGKGFKENGAKARKIDASTAFETCTEQLSPFGGLLPLIKFLDLVRFKEIFDSTYLAPRRDHKLGHHLMVVGIFMLLFIGFNRLWHFTYIRLDAMLCGFFRLTKLPVATTFWRYVDSLGIKFTFFRFFFWFPLFEHQKCRIFCVRPRILRLLKILVIGYDP